MKRSPLKVALFAVLMLYPAIGSAQTWPSMTDPRDETPAARDERMAWWRAARFGMFIHWGVYSVPAGTYKGAQIKGIGEWIMCYGKIPVAEYAKYPAQFDPEKFDAEKWAQIAENAGMKYMVITAKHHDGFAMFRTEVDPFNIVDATPFHRDPLAELVVACKKHNIKLGFYYSQAQDWHQPGGGAKLGHWDPAQEGDFDAYLKRVALPQVKELLTNYGPIAAIWFDTPGTYMTPERAEEFFPLLKLQPQIIINNRLGGGFKGDTETPEQRIPPQGFPGRDWETCMTINDTWGYKSYDTNFKSNETLLHNLVDIASKGGNYLLNVGPDAEGVIPKPEVDRLEFLGKWLKVNGESIYGTGPTPFGPEGGSLSTTQKDRHGKPVFEQLWDWRCTSNPGKLYIHLLKWPGEKFELSDLKESVKDAYMLADPQHQPLKFTQDAEHLSVVMPGSTTDPIDSVLVLETKAK